MRLTYLTKPSFCSVGKLASSVSCSVSGQSEKWRLCASEVPLYRGERISLRMVGVCRKLFVANAFRWFL